MKKETYDKLRQLLDDALAKETKESFEKFLDESIALRADFESQKEIKMSGTIGKLDSSDKDYRKVVLDSGGFASLYDFTLDKCGGYKEGDRIVISIAPCGKDEYYYPPRPEQTAAEEE